MAPKKPNRSPFGLFMTKMKRSDPKCKSLPMNVLVGHCAPIYDKLSEEVRKRLDELSRDIRNNGLNEYEANRLLDRLSLFGNGCGSVSADTTQDDDCDQNWDNESTAATSCQETTTNSLATESTTKWSLGFNFSKTSDAKRFKDMTFDDSDTELDTLSILQTAVNYSKDFLKESIVCICFNVVVHTVEGQYYPNEIGLSKFTLKDGFQEFYTKLMYNEVPDGYYAMAKDFAQFYHKIPLNAKGIKGFEDNYELLFNEIYDFMATSTVEEQSGNRKIVFCRAEQTNGQLDRQQTLGCLEWFEKTIRSIKPDLTKSLTEDFLIVNISELLFVVTEKYCKSVRPVNICSEDLNRSIFDFYPDMRCGFHDDDDNNYCALAVTKRMAYLFIDTVFSLELRPELDLKIKPSHRPRKPDVGSTTYTMFPPTVPPLPERSEYRYYVDSQSVPKKNEEPRPLDRGIGRGRFMQNIRNMRQ